MDAVFSAFCLAPAPVLPSFSPASVICDSCLCNGSVPIKMYVDRGPKSEDEEDSFWD